MRALRLVVNDIARAMKHRGRIYQQPGHSPCDIATGTLLLNYAAMLTSATKRSPKKKAK